MTQSVVDVRNRYRVLTRTSSPSSKWEMESRYWFCRVSLRVREGFGPGMQAGDSDHGYLKRAKSH
jgi:hypothetical protein